jgi:hypothetical protein
MYWRVALLILFIANVPQAKAEPTDEQALRLLSHYRQLAGLTPAKLDRKLSAGCMEQPWAQSSHLAGRTCLGQAPRVRHVLGGRFVSRRR